VAPSRAFSWMDELGSGRAALLFAAATHAAVAAAAFLATIAAGAGTLLTAAGFTAVDT
jgi:hypothetical protein